MDQAPGRFRREPREDAVHRVVVLGLAQGTVGEAQVAPGVSDAGRGPDLRDGAAEVDSVADHAQAPGLRPYHDLALLRRFPVVVARRDLRHRPKSNPSRSPASSPIALRSSCAAARNAPIPSRGPSEILSSW